jgi:hypothetical protein
MSFFIVYVDEPIFIGKKPQAFFDSLKNEHGFKLKGVGKPSYRIDESWLVECLAHMNLGKIYAQESLSPELGSSM